ncbi:choline ABC transporter substrate-binding protein [Xanthobacter nonsaccharivorans]|uniref:choline ABC transporter substrate-binding protein n=1 Tax=Xanthobacter nonsaccharivorans TaxID=3119912 RepID=UPI00372D857C
MGIRAIRALAATLALGVGISGLAGLPAQAADAPACKTVRFADVGWTDIAATTAITSTILKGLGYTPKTQVLAVPVTYTSMKNKDIDVFLGNWMPTMEADRKPYVEDKSVEVLGANLEGAKYTLAVPTYLYDEGLKTFADIAKFKDKLKGKIYGIEPGNDGNRLIIGMIKDNNFGLGKFEIVESSEQGMLSQVDRLSKRKEAIVFLGWEPHPMNTKFAIKYLEGGDDVFGPNLGGATIYTNVRAGWLDACPNAGTLIKNLKFSLPIENTVMGYILFDSMDADKAATKWLKANPKAWEPWLAGVTTFDGKPGLEAVKKSLNL